MPAKKERTFIGDFETSVYPGQTNTEVWASALTEIGTDEVIVLKSIEETFNYLVNLNCNVVVYYHNLKFDGMFWISYLLYKQDMTQAFEKLDEDGVQQKIIKKREMKNNTFNYMISSMGNWYNIVIKKNRHTIELRDSLKLLPFSVKQIGYGFETEHKKTEIEYKGERHANGTITEQEEQYIKNDVLVVNEALTKLREDGHTGMTIGSCCMKQYKQTVYREDFKRWFPNIYDISIAKEIYGVENAGEYIRKSYRGGWCYLVPGKSKRVLHNGCTFDVNSLYPSVMSSESGNIYPIGDPHFWIGDIPFEATDRNHYYFLTIKTRFKIKSGKLPFIQIKNNLLYRGNVSLTTSDYYDKKSGKYYSQYINVAGEVEDTYVTLTMTMTDYELFKEHYDLINPTIIGGCWFRGMEYLFDDYIEYYKRIKMNSTGAKRTLAKLFLNNLYGRMAMNTNSSFKVCYKKDDGTIGFRTIPEFDKKPGYIPIGSAITSYARNFTIRAAQKNYHGPDKPGFVYADTDSIHCDIEPEKIEGIEIDDSQFCKWKLESTWDVGYFTRQKTYIEHIKTKNGYEYDVKCAGMPERSKKLFIASITGKRPDFELADYEEEFVNEKRTLNDFDVGLCVPGKLIQRQMPGGVVLADSMYEMRELY